VSAASLPNVQPGIRLRPIALPVEHGGWGMVGAPILCGLLLVPSWSGALLGLAGLAAFLTRQPLRLALTDVRKGKRYPRTGWAIRFAVLYASVGVIALTAAALTSRAPFFLPLLIAAALGGIQFGFDLQGKGRNFVPEVCGASAMALLATGIVQAGAFTSGRSWLLALALALQTATAISYAAARVRLARDVHVLRWPVWAAHAVSLASILAVVLTGLMTWPIVAAFMALMMRASWGLSAMRRDVRAAVVGMQEVGYALMTVICIVASMH
jgi:hypothetical protein